MKQAELAQYRAMLQAQAAEPARRGLFGARQRAVAAPVLVLASGSAGVTVIGGPPPRRGRSLFGRRAPEPVLQPVEPAEPLILDMPVEAVGRLRLRALVGAHHMAETPYHAEDLADSHAPVGPTPGIIAGWSNVKPPSAQLRLLRRLGAVIEAERQGLGARLAAAGIEAA